MVSWISKPRVGRYVFFGACPILSVSNSGSTQQKRTLKIAMGKKSPVRFFALGLCFADHRSRKYRNIRHAYKTPGAHNLALNTQNRDFFEFYKCLPSLSNIPTLLLQMSVISYIIHILSTTHPSDIHLLHKYFISCSHSTCVAPGRHVSTSRRGTVYYLPLRLAQPEKKMVRETRRGLGLRE